jgi:hypothetical protein
MVVSNQPILVLFTNFHLIKNILVLLNGRQKCKLSNPQSAELAIVVLFDMDVINLKISSREWMHD